MEELSELFTKHGGNRTLRLMLRSYKAAVDDPRDEFTHLYEIRDALLVRFGFKHKAAGQALRYSEDEWKNLWDKFTSMCNDPSVRQARHRGKGVANLQDATAKELEFARGFASSLIERYVRYLEAQSTEWRP